MTISTSRVHTIRAIRMTFWRSKDPWNGWTCKEPGQASLGVTMSEMAAQTKSMIHFVTCQWCKTFTSTLGCDDDNSLTRTRGWKYECSLGQHCCTFGVGPDLSSSPCCSGEKKEKQFEQTRVEECADCFIADAFQTSSSHVFKSIETKKKQLLLRADSGRASWPLFYAVRNGDDGDSGDVVVDDDDDGRRHLTGNFSPSNQAPKEGGKPWQIRITRSIHFSTWSCIPSQGYHFLLL